jgi:hypothetical protein
MSKCELVIQTEKSGPQCTPGEIIRGRVRATLGENPVKCRALTIRHEWRTHGRGNTRSGTSASITLFEGAWAAGERQEYPFELKVPTGPATYHGHFLNVDHYLVAEADVPWSFDPKAELELLLPAVDSPDYSFGPEYKEPAAEMRAASQSSTLASCLVGGCFGLPGLAIILGGIGMLVGAIHGHGDYAGGIFLSLFGIPFAAIGFGLVYVMQKRRLAQQRLGLPLIKVSPNPARPGERVSVQVFMEPPKALNLADSRISLVGREKVVSGSGTNRTTHTHDIHLTDEDLNTAGRHVEPGEPVTLQQSITIPTDAAPTFVADDNELKWAIKVQIGIEGWPNWEQEYPVTVRPR